MKTIEDLTQVIQAGLRNWPKDQQELKFAKTCKDVQDFVDRVPLDILVWTATQLDRNTVHSHPAWEVYKQALNEASLNYMPVSEEAIKAYQLQVESLCMQVLTQWYHGIENKV